MALCIVSYVDTEGLRHTVEVEAESLYEAAVLAMHTFRKHDCEPGLISQLEVEIRSSVTRTVTPKRIDDWLNGGAKTPKEAVMKERLREMLGQPTPMISRPLCSVRPHPNDLALELSR